MTTPERPPRRPLEPRAVVEGIHRAIRSPEADLPARARRARRRIIEPPPDSFADGVEAHRTLRHMCPETEEGCDLGPYIPPPEGAASLGGHARTIRFPAHWHAWFARQDAARLAALDEIVDARIEQGVIRGYFRRLKHAAILAFVGAAAAAHWFSDQVAWVVERVPVLRAVWRLLTGSAR